MNPRATLGSSSAFFGALSRALHTAEGAVRGESRGGYWKGETSESLNPMDGFGMKQGREGAGGKRRQEVEKTWRRSTAE